MSDSTPTGLVRLPADLEWIRPLGDGKMAHVHLARETELRRLVAVKVLRPEVARNETARLRFEREAHSAASLAHPNVVSVYRFGRLDDGTPYLVMSYVEGRTLADRLAADGPLDETEARHILAQIASALAAAHRKGIVHRDVRAENVLLDEDERRALLTDFGIAAVRDSGRGDEPRLTRTGQILGQPRYASPEQLESRKVTGQADVYSLAILAYEMLTGEGPYRASSNREWIHAHLTGEPRPLSTLRPGVSPDLEDLLLRCLAREPARRPRSEDVMRRLQGREETEGSGFDDDGLGIRRRRLPQIVFGAVAGAWVLLETVDYFVFDRGWLPEFVFGHGMNLIAFGMIATMVIGWFHGEKGRQRVTAAEKWILGLLAAGWAAVTVLLIVR